MNYRIFPPQELITASVDMPLSKSESARALIINALTENAPALPPLAECDDTASLRRALSSTSGTVDVGAAGTAMRFLTAYYASLPGCDVVLRGSERMHERPIGLLVDALRECDAEIQYLDKEGFPPLHIVGRRLRGGLISIDSTVSSQYISALMMVGPLMEGGLKLDLVGSPASMPYITLTASMMRRAGIEVEISPLLVSVPEGKYSSTSLVVGGDWSAASYWYEIEALTSGFVTLKGLDEQSLQGDSSVAELFSQLGVTTEPSDETPGALELVASPDLSPRLIRDFTHTPDLVQTAVVTCVMLGIPFRFSGTKSLRVKETDRVEALRAEMLKLGAVVSCDEPGIMEWDGVRRPIDELPVFDTYSDHRMAMSLAPVGCYIPGIVIRNAEVVDKSYPGFFDDMRSAGFVVVDASLTAEEVEEILNREYSASVDSEK